MKALTIWQPWAALIMARAKPWEWRGWKPPRYLVGQRLVIHAGARKVPKHEIVQLLRDIRAGDTSLVADKALAVLDATRVDGFLLACGLGTALVGEPINAADWAARHNAPGHDSDRVDHHMWGWPLSDIRAFPAPVPMRGAQGLWEWP